MNSQNEMLHDFLVLEGLDGSGTTTQASLLARRCEQEGRAHWLTGEPTKEPIGGLIRRFLKGDEPVHPDTMALLFAADRSEHLRKPVDGVIARCTRGELVICDRYIFSSLAYQSVACDPQFVEAVNGQFPLPRWLVYLDVPVDECVRRLADRSHREIYEAVDFLDQVRTRYEDILAEFADSDMEIIRIDGTATAEEIAETIWNATTGRPITGV